MTSEKLASLSWPAEVFYRRLMSVVDDFGRYYATPMLLRAACYPLQLDKVSDSDVGKWLGETRKAGLVRVFESGGKPYLEMQNFRQQVRAHASKFPQPPADAQQMHSTCIADAKQVLADAHLDVDVDVDVDVDEDEDSVAVAPLALLPLVDGSEYPVTPAMVAEWRLAYPAVDVLQQLREMRVWLLANAKNRKTRSGIGRFITGWLSKNQNKAPRRPAEGNAWDGAI